MSKTRKKKSHTRTGEEETEEIYDERARREMKPDKKKHPTHKDTVSVEVAEEEYE